MSMDFGKLNFAVGFNRTSAFPLDANSYFESYTDAVAAAAGAAVVGSSDSAYYIGQLIIVNESGKFGLYQIGADNTLVKFGQASSADDLKSQLDALKATVEELNTSKADWLGGTAPVDKNGEIVTIGAVGSITASGIKIVNSAVNNSTTEVPTSKAVQTYVASQVASAVQYLGTVSALTGLSTTAGKGDFYRLSAAVAGGHAGDLVIAEKDNPAQLIDGTNWSLIHGEEVGVEAINAGDGIKVITTGEGSSEAQPTIAMKPATTTTIGGIIVGDNLTVDGTGKLSATDTTYTLPIASDTTLGGVKVDSVESTPELLIPTTTPNRDYAVKADEEGVLWVTIPWTDTKYTLPIATTSVLGGVKSTKTGTTAGKNYSVEVNTDGTMKVNVPWTDNNTFRTIQVDTAQTDAVAPLNLKSGTNIALALEHSSESENVTINHAGPGSASQSSASATASDGGTVAFGGEFYVPTFAIDANGHTRDLGRIKYKLPTPETYSLQIATTSALGGIKSGVDGKSFTEVSGGAKNYQAEVVVNSSTGIAHISLQNLIHDGSLQWVSEGGYTGIDVKEISTDKIVQGTNTLVINGGGAAW